MLSSYAKSVVIEGGVFVTRGPFKLESAHFRFRV